MRALYLNTCCLQGITKYSSCNFVLTSICNFAASEHVLVKYLNAFMHTMRSL